MLAMQSYVPHMNRVLAFLFILSMLVVTFHPWPKLNCLSPPFHQIRQHFFVESGKRPVGQLRLNCDMNAVWWLLSNDNDIPRARAFVLEAIDGEVAVILYFKNELLERKVDCSCSLLAPTESVASLLKRTGA